MFHREKLSYRPIPLPDRMELDADEMQSAADGFLERMSKRHSVREYSDKPVPLSVIEACIKAAGLAPSGANHQPWHFVAIAAPALKKQIRIAAEEEEKKFYAGNAGDEWIKALEPMGTDATKPHLEVAPWLIVIFSERYGEFSDGQRYKNYYVPESVGISTGFLITALHHAGLVSLTHTPNPMAFLNDLCDRPASNKPVMILALGHPADDATVPAIAKIKKPLEEIMTVRE
jgi:nitroreductase